MTDFSKVCEFNKCFDFPVHDDLSDKKCLKLRIDLIYEELNELKIAYEKNDLIEQMDACADILYVCYGMAYTYNCNSDKYFAEHYYLHDCNATLFHRFKFEHLNYKEFIDNVLFHNFNDLVEATTNDLKTTLKCLHQLIFNVYAFQKLLNFDSDKIFDLVHSSNMSKLCQNIQEAEATVDKYAKYYVEYKSPYDSPYYYQLPNGLYVVKNRSTGKALKSINYTLVKLDHTYFIK
jgi:predicted HAD superfamily Cof-like phosphohydrolase